MVTPLILFVTDLFRFLTETGRNGQNGAKAVQHDRTSVIQQNNNQDFVIIKAYIAQKLFLF